MHALSRISAYSATYSSKILFLTDPECSLTSETCAFCTNNGSSGRPAGPAKHRQKFRQHHRRCAPDFMAADVKGRNGLWETVSFALGRYEILGVQKIFQAHLEDVRHLRVRRGEPRVRRGHGKYRVEAEAADRNVQRGQHAEHANLFEPQPDFLVRLAQRGLLDGFAWLDAAAWQRHLTAVTPERVGAHGKHDVRVSRR